MGNMKFSICMPTYNDERFIKETISSILSQSMELCLLMTDIL